MKTVTTSRSLTPPPLLSYRCFAALLAPVLCLLSTVIPVSTVVTSLLAPSSRTWTQCTSVERASEVPMTELKEEKKEKRVLLAMVFILSMASLTTAVLHLLMTHIDHEDRHRQCHLQLWTTNGTVMPFKRQQRRQR